MVVALTVEDIMVAVEDMAVVEVMAEVMAEQLGLLEPMVAMQAECEGRMETVALLVWVQERSASHVE